MNTVQNKVIYAIIGETEYLDFYNKDILEKDGTVLISIRDPDKLPHPESKIQGFSDVLQINFWDIESTMGDTEVISQEQGNIIRDFILKNKDKQFLIHCAAGVSRSAGVGMAVECLVNHNGDKYQYSLNGSDIVAHTRYSPNYTVYDTILKEV